MPALEITMKPLILNKSACIERPWRSITALICLLIGCVSCSSPYLKKHVACFPPSNTPVRDITSDIKKELYYVVFKGSANDQEAYLLNKHGYQGYLYTSPLHKDSSSILKSLPINKEVIISLSGSIIVKDTGSLAKAIGNHGKIYFYDAQINNDFYLLEVNQLSKWNNNPLFKEKLTCPLDLQPSFNGNEVFTGE